MAKYLILQLTPSKEDGYLKNEFVKFLERSDGNPYDCLNKTVIDYIKQRGGIDNADGLQITPIDNLTKITIPDKDGYYAFKLEDMRGRAFIYKKSTEIVPGWVFGNNIAQDWQLVTYFDLISCEQREPEQPSDYTMVPSQSNPAIMVPIVMTVAPYTELIAELKENKLFLRKKAEREACSE